MMSWRGRASMLAIIALILFALCIFLVWLCLLPAAGAQWSRTFGGHGQDNCFSLAGTSDGGYLVGGWTSWHMQNDSYAWSNDNLFLLKTDKDGNPEWYNIYGDNHSFMGGYAREAPGGGFILAGSIGQYDAGSIYLVKTDTGGRVLWEKNCRKGFVGRVKSLEVTPDGYILAGNDNGSVFLIKFDRDGTIQWDRMYGGHGLDAGSILPTSDGGNILTGGPDFMTGGRAFLLKTDASGNESWLQYYGSGNTGGLAVIEDRAGGFVIAGTKSEGAADPWYQYTGSDIYMVRTAADGSVLWERDYDASPDDDYATSIVQMDDGGYAVTGYAVRVRESHYVIDADAFLLRLDKNGTQQWIKKFGSPGEARGISVVKSNDGALVLAGDRDNNDILLIKTPDAPDVLSPLGEAIMPVRLLLSHNPVALYCMAPLFILLFLALALTLITIKRAQEKRIKKR